MDALHEFRALNIDFISYQEAIDTSSPIGEAMFTIIGKVRAGYNSRTRESGDAANKANDLDDRRRWLMLIT